MDEFTHKIIDQGLDGIILYPGLNTKPGFVGKIGADMVLQEYENIQKISQLNLKLPINVRGFEIRELNSEEKDLYLNFMKPDPTYRYLLNKTIYQLQLPYINGKNLYDILDFYKTTYYDFGRTNHVPETMNEKYLQKYNNASVMAITEFVQLYNILIELKEKVKYMNENRIFHNDINEGNIMMDENGDLLLIDFSRATVGYEIKPEDEDEDGEVQYWPDREKMNFVIESFMWTSCQNPILYAYFKDKNIFSFNHFNEHSQTLKDELRSFVDKHLTNEKITKAEIEIFADQFF